MEYGHLYDRAQELDRATDALTFKLNGVVDPAERAALQSQINLATQRASDAWADFHDAEYAQRAASAGRPTALATAASSQPAQSAAEMAARRRAETAAFWRKIVGRVNAEMFGSGPDSSPNASGGAPLNSGQKPKSNPSSREVWRRAISAANAAIAGNEPSASREGQASSNGRPQTGSDFLSGTITAAGKQLKDAGFAVVR